MGLYGGCHGLGGGLRRPTNRPRAQLWGSCRLWCLVSSVSATLDGVWLQEWRCTFFPLSFLFLFFCMATLAGLWSRVLALCPWRLGE